MVTKHHNTFSLKSHPHSLSNIHVFENSLYKYQCVGKMFFRCIISKKKKSNRDYYFGSLYCGTMYGINEVIRPRLLRGKGRKRKFMPGMSKPVGHLNSPFYHHVRLKTQSNFTQILKIKRNGEFDWGCLEIMISGNQL